MKKLTLILALAQAAVLYAAESTRYKDRMFKVGEPTTVTVVDSVPFLDTTNFHSLSSMMQMVGVEPMMYFYEDEKIAYEPLLMDIYQPKREKAKKRPEGHVSCSTSPAGWSNAVMSSSDGPLAGTRRLTSSTRPSIPLKASDDRGNCTVIT